MPDWRAYPSAITTEINSIPDTVVDPPESIGTPGDAAATAQNSTNSIFALLKGCLADLGVPAGTGDATVTTPKKYPDLPATLGSRTDSAQSDFSSTASAIALTKGVLSLAGL